MAQRLGGGREGKEDRSTPQSAYILHKKGSAIEAGEALCTGSLQRRPASAHSRCNRLSRSAIRGETALSTASFPENKQTSITLHNFTHWNRHFRHARGSTNGPIDRDFGPGHHAGPGVDIFQQPSCHPLAHGGVGPGLQIVFAIFVLRLTSARPCWRRRAARMKFLAYSFAGSGLVFGELGKQLSSLGMIFAFQVLPTIIFISAFFAVLYHYGVMQLIIRLIAKLMSRPWGSAARKAQRCCQHLHGPDRSAAHHPSVSLRRNKFRTHDHHDRGMAHVSGGIMAAYILYGVEAKHLLAPSS